jgi:hypothetical protein
MSATDVNVVSNQIEKIWSPLFMKELRENMLLGALVNRAYEGSISGNGADTVYVSQLNAPQGQLKTVGTDADYFDSESMSLSRIAVQANKRAVASFEIADLVDLQSQLGAQDSEIREALMYSVSKQINDYLFSFVSPSTSAPDHLLNSITDMNAAQLAAIRLLAAKAKWSKSPGWYGLLDPSYYSDILNAQTLTSSDYVGDEAPVIGGQVVKQRYGFNLLEDNSMGTDKGLFFHPDFLHLVMQQEPRFKVSDLHPNKKFGYVISVDIVFGAALGINGNLKHIFATAAASGSDAS